MLRAFETGQDVPETEVADALAATLDVSIDWILGRSSSSRQPPVQKAPIRQATPVPEHVAALRSRLRRGGHDENLAEEFASNGIPDGVLKQWLNRFDASEALAWLQAGAKPMAAWQAKQQGLTPETFALPPTVQGSTPAGPLVATGATVLVAETWVQYSSTTAGLDWLGAGWDLLAALAWIETGLGPELSLRWRAAKVLPADRAVAAASVGDPETAARWVTTGLPATEWPLWIGRKFDPEAAILWSGVGIPAAEAADYRRLVGKPNRAGWYREHGVGAHAGARWDGSGLGWAKIQGWIEAGVEVDEAKVQAAKNVSPEAFVRNRMAAANAAKRAAQLGPPIAPRIPKGKAERLRMQASAFGLIPDEFTYVRQQVQAAESNLTGSAKERASLTARRLSIIPAELKVLRAAMTAHAVPIRHGPQPRQLARQVLSLAPLRTTFDRPAHVRPGAQSVASKPKPPPASPARGAISPIKRGIGPTAIRDWGPNTSVYITPLGNVVHMYSNCHGMRGFRHPDEADPVVSVVTLRSPVCADRKACRKCFDWGPASLRQLDDLIDDLHGRGARRGPDPIRTSRPQKKRKRRRR